MDTDQHRFTQITKLVPINVVRICVDPYPSVAKKSSVFLSFIFHPWYCHAIRGEFFLLSFDNIPPGLKSASAFPPGVSSASGRARPPANGCEPSTGSAPRRNGTAFLSPVSSRKGERPGVTGTSASSRRASQSRPVYRPRKSQNGWYHPSWVAFRSSWGMGACVGKQFDL